MSEDRSASYHRSRCKAVKKSLLAGFARNEGVMLDKFSVASQKVHLEPPEAKGVIYVYAARDAGMAYLKMLDPNLVVHLDIFHSPAEVNIIDLAHRIRVTISHYLELTAGNEPDRLPERETLALNLAQRIFLKTAAGEGPVLDPAPCPGQPGEQSADHVHILAKLPDRYYGLVHFIVDQVEKAISFQGYQLRPVKKIVPVYEETAAEHFPLGVPLNRAETESAPEVRRQNCSQVLMAMAAELGGLELVESLLDLISPLHIIGLSRFGKKHPALEKILQDLTALGYLKKDAIGYSLTSPGQELKEFLQQHRKELAAQIRKAIRHLPPSPGVTPSGRFCRVKSRLWAFYDRRKTTGRDRDNWYNPLAVPETVVKAAKRSLKEEKKFEIKEQDLMVFQKRSQAPVDICLVVDCSGSMKGAKLRAVQWVAEYLILTTRDRVALVSFQERDAQVLVPFTRSYPKLHQSLLTLAPEGLTPVAKGLLTGLELIAGSKPRNPLLALITDGRPNIPLFSTDPVADAIKVCSDFPKHKIRFVIIGIDPAGEFIPQLAKAGSGNYYLVDDIDRTNLVRIMRSERTISSFPKS